MDSAAKSLLMIFYRNPIPGTVKTRLAATVGDEKALDVFNKLALHTRAITENLPMDKVVYYSDTIEKQDIWIESDYRKLIQRGSDLGERMRNAFASAFKQDYDTVCIIGTDCYELTSDIISRAFASLRVAHAVIGPARDGGYYLLGMHKLHENVFTNKNWSTETVLQNTIDDFHSLGLRYVKLPVLRDVDREDDIPQAWKR